MEFKPIRHTVVARSPFSLCLCFQVLIYARFLRNIILASMGRWRRVVVVVDAINGDLTDVVTKRLNFIDCDHFCRPYTLQLGRGKKGRFQREEFSRA